MNNLHLTIKQEEIMESKVLGVLLTTAAGFMGAYSYLLCGQIFSNGLTGNLIFFSINLEQANYIKAFTYLNVVFGFSLGVFFAYFVRYIFPNNTILSFRQTNILIEIILLILVIIIKPIRISHFLITFVCGMQIENYEKIRGMNVSTVNFVGNTKIGAHELCVFIDKKDQNALIKALKIYMLMLFFIIGAFLGVICINKMGENALIICVLILLSAFIYTFINKQYYLKHNSNV